MIINLLARIGMAILLMIAVLSKMSAQSGVQKKEELLKVGKPCPDFTLDHVEYYPKKSVSLKDFRGKWLILDCWTSRCMACISSFPHTNQMQKEFAGKVQYLLVGNIAAFHDLNERSDDQHIRSLYNKLRVKEQLELSIAFDSVFFKQFDIGACPYMIIIDEKGIVRGLTTMLNSDQLNDLLMGGTPVLNKPYNLSQFEQIENSYDQLTPLLVHGNGGDETDFIYRSVLTRYKSSQPVMAAYYFYRINNLAQFTGMSLPFLYQAAFGDTTLADLDFNIKPADKFWNRPVLETRDSLLFKKSILDTNALYNYSQVVPAGKATSLNMQKNMQRDLTNYFGYKVTVEKRQMPCWNLIANQGAKEKLKTKGSPYAMEGDYVNGFTLTNAPVSSLIGALWTMNQLGPPYIDLTGICGNIDIRMNHGTYFHSETLDELRKYGLDLVKDSIRMKVIVIRDPSDQ